jgi:hypothetical protein
VAKAQDRQQPYKTEPSYSPRLLGAIALTLWTIAPLSSAATAELAYNKTKILLFVGGLLMMDIALAVLASVVWLWVKHYVNPQAENRAVDDYLLRAAHAAAAQKRLKRTTDLHLVRPPEPRRSSDGVALPNSEGRADDHVS